jgi:ribosomal 50S subunit-recycling heat shock protein
MRLDKYLKVSRLMKRRTVAKDVAEKSNKCQWETSKAGLSIKAW